MIRNLLSWIASCLRPKVKPLLWEVAKPDLDINWVHPQMDLIDPNLDFPVGSTYYERDVMRSHVGARGYGAASNQYISTPNGIIASDGISVVFVS